MTKLFALLLMMFVTVVAAPEAFAQAAKEIKIADRVPPGCAKKSKEMETERPQMRGARVPGAIIFSDSELGETIKIPPIIEAGKDFQITVMTSGNGCVSQGDTEVILGEKSADVFVYDSTSATAPDIVCTMIFKQFPHTATLRFDTPGEALIRIWGRRQGAGSSPVGEPFLIEQKVYVR